MNKKLIFLLLFVFISKVASCQELNTIKLDDFFNSLEKRNEAMGCITIYKNGKTLYTKAIGYRNITDEKKTASDTKTNYRIWSITKTYTAVMIFSINRRRQIVFKNNIRQILPSNTKCENHYNSKYAQS